MFRWFITITVIAAAAGAQPWPPSLVGSFPAPLDIDYTWTANGSYKTITVTVTTTGNQEVPGAKVCLWQSLYYLTGTTGTDGRIRFKDILHDFSDGKLTATKHNYKPATKDNVTIGGE